MGAPFATVDDVDALRTLDSDERERAGVLLTFASAKIRKNVPGIDARITAAAPGDEDLAQLAQYVAVQMVIRVLRNPDGVRQETVGPSSISYDTSSPLGQLVITGDELATLEPNPTGIGIGTARIGAGLGGGPGGIVNDRQASRLPRGGLYGFPR